MNMLSRKLLSLAAASLALLALPACASLNYYNQLPASQKVLFAPQAERDAGFRAMENYGPVHVIAAGPNARPLPAGRPLELLDDVDGFVARQHVAGLLVIQDGRVRVERYGLGFDRNGRWTSFSMAKSITSTLVGAALRDGAIKSLDDSVTSYVPGLRGSAYDSVTVRQLLTMTSGVRWSENYGDPRSDVARFIIQRPGPEGNATVSYMKQLTREALPGSRWHYSTGETNLVGELVASATGKTLSAYLSEKIWQPYGMESDAIWYLDSSGHELGGCCISATLRDYGRFG
jgi:CubicO group peptidase (beta-lactamase class C family)